MVLNDPSTRHTLVKLLADLLDVYVTSRRCLPREEVTVVTVAWLLRVGAEAHALACAVAQQKENPAAAAAAAADGSEDPTASFVVRKATARDRGDAPGVAEDVRDALSAFAVLHLAKSNAPGAVVELDEATAALARSNSLLNDLLVRYVCRCARAGEEDQAIALLRPEIGLATNPALRRSLQVFVEGERCLPRLRLAALRNVYLPAIVKARGASSASSSSSSPSPSPSLETLVEAHDFFAAMLTSPIVLSTMEDRERGRGSGVGLDRSDVASLLREALADAGEIYAKEGFRKAAVRYEKLLQTELFASLRDELRLPVVDTRPKSRVGGASGGFGGGSSAFPGSAAMSPLLGTTPGLGLGLGTSGAATGGAGLSSGVNVWTGGMGGGPTPGPSSASGMVNASMPTPGGGAAFGIGGSGRTPTSTGMGASPSPSSAYGSPGMGMGMGMGVGAAAASASSGSPPPS